MIDCDGHGDATMALQRDWDDAALQRWLSVSLKERHAAALREPVPDALLDLLRAPQDR